jgi:hypothetical protein
MRNMSNTTQCGHSKAQLVAAISAAFPGQPYCVRHAAELRNSEGHQPASDENAADFSSVGVTWAAHSDGSGESAVLSSTHLGDKKASSKGWPGTDDSDDVDDDPEGGDDPEDNEPPWTFTSVTPPVLQRREQLVERGDFAAIYQEILHAPWDETQRLDAFSQVFRAIDVASRNDAGGCSAELLRLLVSTAGYLTLRAQYTLLRRIQAADGQSYSRPVETPRDVLETYLGQLMSMQNHLAELCQSQAATARQWQLTRQKELENERRALKRRRKRSLTGKAAGAKHCDPANGVQGPRKGNGHVSNRVASLLENGEQQAETA